MLHGCSKRLSEDLPHARLSAAYEECDRKMGMAWLFFTSATNHVLVHLSPAGVCGNEHNSFSFFSCPFGWAVYISATAFCNAKHWLHFAAVAGREDCRQPVKT